MFLNPFLYILKFILLKYIILFLNLILYKIKFLLIIKITIFRYN